jgi:hypothetical protein
MYTLPSSVAANRWWYLTVGMLPSIMLAAEFNQRRSLAASAATERQSNCNIKMHGNKLYDFKRMAVQRSE